MQKDLQPTKVEEDQVTTLQKKTENRYKNIVRELKE